LAIREDCLSFHPQPCIYKMNWRNDRN